MNWQDIEREYRNGTINTYRPDPDHANLMLASGRTPVFSEVAPIAMDAPDRDTYLWRILSMVLQHHYKNPSYKWTPQYQKFGTCAGQATKLACDFAAAVNVVLADTIFPGRFSVAGCYTGARVDIANRPGKWEGSTGSWQVDWITKYGCLLLTSIGLDDESKDPDENLAMKWTNTNEGVPKEFETAARLRPITQTPLMQTAREVAKCIQLGGVCINGSTLIPNGKRDKHGYSAPLPSQGGHMTAFTAVRYNPFGILYQNSWSEEWGTGSVFPNDQPPGSVWIDEDGCNAICQQGDTYGVIGLAGLVPRTANSTKIITMQGM